MIEQTIDLIIKVVDEATYLSTLDITVVLNYFREFIPHVMRSQRTGFSYDLTIYSNMLSWVKGKWVVDHYKELFRDIMTKASISSLTIRMLGLLSTLVGALGAMVEGTEPRNYDLLILNLERHVLLSQGVPPIERILATLSPASSNSVKGLAQRVRSLCRCRKSSGRTLL